MFHLPRGHAAVEGGERSHPRRRTSGHPGGCDGGHHTDHGRSDHLARPSGGRDDGVVGHVPNDTGGHSGADGTEHHADDRSRRAEYEGLRDDEPTDVGGFGADGRQQSELPQSSPGAGAEGRGRNEGDLDEQERRHDAGEHGRAVEPEGSTLVVAEEGGGLGGLHAPDDSAAVGGSRPGLAVENHVESIDGGIAVADFAADEDTARAEGQWVAARRDHRQRVVRVRAQEQPGDRSRSSLGQFDRVADGEIEAARERLRQRRLGCIRGEGARRQGVDAVGQGIRGVQRGRFDVVAAQQVPAGPRRHDVGGAEGFLHECGVLVEGRGTLPVEELLHRRRGCRVESVVGDDLVDLVLRQWPAERAGPERLDDPGGLARVPRLLFGGRRIDGALAGGHDDGGGNRHGDERHDQK